MPRTKSGKRLNLVDSFSCFRTQKGILHTTGLKLVLIHSGEDGEVLDEPVDHGEEDGGGGDDDQQPLLVALPVLGGDPSGADGDEEAGGEGDLQCVPVGGACLNKSLLI